MADLSTLAFNLLNPWAWLRSMSNRNIGILVNAGVPTNGTSGTGAGKAGPGCLLIDVTGKILYINTNTKASPTWSAQVTTGANSFFVSAEQTGTGSAQNIAHGLGVTPSKVVGIPTDLSPATVGQYTLTLGAHTSTNVVATVTTGKKYVVMAWV